MEYTALSSLLSHLLLLFAIVSAEPNHTLCCSLMLSYRLSQSVDFEYTRNQDPHNSLIVGNIPEYFETPKECPRKVKREISLISYPKLFVISYLYFLSFCFAKVENLIGNR